MPAVGRLWPSDNDGDDNDGDDNNKSYNDSGSHLILGGRRGGGGFRLNGLPGIEEGNDWSS